MQVTVWYTGDLNLDRKLKEFSKNNAALVIPVVGAVDPNLAKHIAEASKPIKDMMLGIADPVCYIVFAWGLLECMLGKSGSGITRMKYAAIGYLGMSWIPTFMDVLRGARP